MTFADLDVAIFPLIAISAFAIARKSDGAQSQDSTPSQDQTFSQAAIITISVLLAFFWVLGYYQSRLTFSLAPPALVLIVTSLNRINADHPRRRKLTRIAIFIAAAIWCPYHVLSYGPYH